MKKFLQHVNPNASRTLETLPEQSGRKYVVANRVGGRGTLLPVCPAHGDAHPAGSCPGILANRGGASRGAQGLPDPINHSIMLATDRKQIFKDSNPYLFDVEEWASM
uniref:Transcription factor ETV6 n=1 Tax=Lygus hesperus TaxID=30085 RepID=A0A0A9Z387_LYGHE